jgi:hypothetical protein
MPKFEQAKLRRQDVLVLKNTRTGQIEKVVFPNGIEVGLPQTGFNAGIRLPNISEGPSNTTEKLYVVDGVLYYDGNPLVGSNLFPNGLSGSLTQLVDGTSYLVAGTNITITSQSNGPITISSSGGGGGSPGGSDTQVQFNDGGSFGGDSDFSWNKTTNNLTVSGTVELLTASFKSTAFAGTVNLQAPFDLATDLTFTLPEADGTKFQTLQTDSAGNLSFDYADRI